jgi:hypothetical protein
MARLVGHGDGCGGSMGIVDRVVEKAVGRTRAGAL